MTGANEGLGFALCEELASPDYNYRIIITAIKEDSAKETACRIKEKYPEAEIFSLELNLKYDADHDRVFEAVKSFFVKDGKIGAIDCLVNNAAIGPSVDLFCEHTGAIPNDLIIENFEVNYRKQLTFTARMIPLLTEDAKIVNIGSQFGKVEHQSKEIQEKIRKAGESGVDAFEKYEEILREF